MVDRKNVRRIAALSFSILVILSILVYWLLGIPLRNAEAEWRSGRFVNSAESLERWRKLHIRAADYDEMLALLWLSTSRPENAKPYLDRASRRWPQIFPPLKKLEVAQRFVEHGKYDEFLQYDAAVHHRFESGEVDLYRVAAELGAGHGDRAQAIFASVGQGDVDHAHYEALRNAIEQRRSGNYPLFLDRNGRSIAVYQIANRDLVAVDVDFLPLVDRSGGQFTLESAMSPESANGGPFETTLDAGMQKAALASVAGFRGSVVAIDLKTNQILAMASSSGGGEGVNLALAGQYEPGSVVKVLTGMEAIDANVGVDSMFPFECPGFLKIGDRQFLDWARHDRVQDFNDALAVSCNVAFGEMGLKIGSEGMYQLFERAGFNSSAPIDLLSAPLGKTVGRARDPFSIATMSDGLQFETVNALHVAMLASIVANRGVFRAPTLLLKHHTILGDEMPLPLRPQERRVSTVVAADKMKQAMIAVVVNPRGTGKRAAVPGLEIAMKTGTAGERPYNALICAFAPANDPKIAVGMIVEGAGPAELVGAKIAHDFFASVQPRITATK